MVAAAFLGTEERGPSGPSVKDVHAISTDEFDVVGDAQVQLARFLEGDLLPYVLHAYQDYRGIMQFLADKPVEPNRADAYSAKSAALTFFSALVMHKDQTKMKMMRANKGDDEQFERAEKLDSWVYDRTLGYRFCSRFRNFILHKDVEVMNVSWTKGGVRPSGIIVPTSSVTLTVKRDELLDRSLHNDVWSTVRAEIEQFDEVVDLAPLMEEAAAGAEQLAARARTLLFPGISRAVAHLDRMRELFGDTSGNPVLVRLPDVTAFTDGPRSQMQIRHLDFSRADEVRRLLVEARSN